MGKTIGDNLKILRLKNNMSLKDASKRVGLSAPGLMKYEKNIINPSLEKLEELSKLYNSDLDEILNITEDFEIKFNNLKCENRLPLIKQEKIKNRIERKIKNYFDLLEKSEIKLTNKFGVHIVNTISEAESLATKLRIFFQMPIDTPIYNLVHLLENNDMVILTLEVDEITEGFIGFYETIRNVPIIVVPKKDNGYDQRFNIAKFLGELLIVGNYNKDKVTDEFALSLLVPRQALKKEFGNSRKKIDFKEIDIFSKNYKVGYKSIIRRLQECKIITPSNAKYLNVDINKENLKEEIFTEEANRYDKMLYKLNAMGVISNIKEYLE